MFASVHRLRTFGARNRDRPPGQSEWTRGILEFSTAGGDGATSVPRRLILRSAMADPTRGVIFELYRPELIEVAEAHLRVRGIEPVMFGSKDRGAVLQEWLIVIMPAASE